MTVAHSLEIRGSILRAACLAGATSSALAFSQPASANEANFDLTEAFDAAFHDEQQQADSAAGDPVITSAEASAPVSAAPKLIDARLVASQFVDIPVAGDAEETLRYSGRVDAYIDIKGRAFGLDDSFTLTIRPEFTWGEDSNGVIGLIPSNTALFRGEDSGDFDVSVSLSKQWNSGTNLTVGKVNVLDLGGQLPIVGSDGHYGFQNLSFALPPSAVIPNTITGALLTVPTDDALFRLWVFDPDSQFERTGFETAFESGVGFLSSVTFPVKIGGAPGFYALKLSGSTRDDISATNLPSVLVPPPGTTFGNTQGEFAAVLAAYQFLQVYPEAPGKGWGFFGQVYTSLGDPTFLDQSGFFGISGNPRGRPQDRFGAGYFRYSLTDELVDVLAPRIGLEDEEGVELFYTVGVANKFELTANAQIIDSAIAARDTGVLIGMRLTTAF
ncbi:carbohydrate porin [Erythrobacter sp. WH131]|uniref:Carbohydrate porin n=1 Tax=Erythrobacter ani TaxID=2827235 RepID=A0ABS6SK41_9SPHN|nr:carbohydrate porin [Erythrobacter ani]